MDKVNYNVHNDLINIFQHPSNLNDLPELLNYINTYKKALNDEISQEIKHYNPKIFDDAINELINKIIKTWNKSKNIQDSINDITKEISKLDNLKKNLVLSINVFKRLQILSYSIIELNQLLSKDYDYKEIYNHLKNIKELLLFFKDYKSINQINQLNQTINKIEIKLIDNIFIDFEENHGNLYGSLILELIDLKYKDKILSWYYNTQLKDIKSIFFNNFDEAGSLDNLNRRFIYFNNILKNLSGIDNFPNDWNIELELTKIFVALTKEDISKKLSKISRSGNSSSLILSCINTTIEFENSMNIKFNTTYFTKIISKIYEPYLSVWIQEQNVFLQSKLIEFNSVSKIPSEFQVSSESELLKVLKVNNVPNLSNSSIELFKISGKLINQLSKITNGKPMMELSNILNNWFIDYINKILLPIVNLVDESDSSNESINKTESIVYLCMIVNTGDYIINNLDDLLNKFKLDNGQPVSFDYVKDSYLSLINKSILKLVMLVSKDLSFSWRQFENSNWDSDDSDESSRVSNYVIDFKSSIVNNCKLILPLIIRDSYIRAFVNKLVELIIKEFSNRLRLVNGDKGIKINNVEQIMKDIEVIKEFLITLPNYSDPNVSDNDLKVDNFYKKFVTSQIAKFNIILNILKVPILPIDEFIEKYFEIVGDKNISNFKKVLILKGVHGATIKKYLDNFNLQLTVGGDLSDDSILSIIDTIPTDASGSFNPSSALPISTTTTSGSGSTVNSPHLGPKKGTFNFLSPDESRSKLEKNLREFTINSENNINKLNENFKNFGKLFRKDNDS